MTERRGSWRSAKTWLNEHRQPIKSWLELAREFLGIAVIVGGAVWAWCVFGWKERPSLAPRAEFSHTLSWERLSHSDGCRAAYYVSIRNNGVTDFKVTRVEVKGWKFDHNDLGPKQGDFGAYLDLKKFERRTPDFSHEFTDDKSDPFIQSYPPGGFFGHSFEWAMSRAPNMWVFIRVDFYAESEHVPKKDRPKHWHVGDWDEVCTPRTNISPEKAREGADSGLRPAPAGGESATPPAPRVNN